MTLIIRWKSLTCCGRFALAALLVALLGWPGQATATLIHYNIPFARFASATFNDIPHPPPTPPVFEIFFGSFDFDAATETQSNVVLTLTGPLYPNTYTFAAPNPVLNDALVTALDPTHSVQLFIHFVQPLDGTSAIDLMSSMTILAKTGPCELPGCSTERVSGAAFTSLSSPNPVPEPASFAVIGSASVLWMIVGWVNRRRATSGHASATFG
jgi:hypothetical protein